MINPYANCFENDDKFKEALRAQLEVENKLEVLIQPVLPRFSVLDISKSKKVKVSKKLEHTYVSLI